ncbi:MAG: transcription-repair coupling factor, partial [Bacteroidaceae bacterium]|nr:transcription-repair coupling factor [Bacteroidaceae bacterium]
MMHSSELREIFSRSTTVRALAAKLQQLSAGEVLYAEGLSGSSAPAVLSALPSAGGGCCHYLVVMNDADEAGYFYGDLVSMLGDEQVMFFPSPYRRGVKYAQIDATNEILRTDTLSRLASLSEGGQDEGAGSFFIVTYPEALAVKVVTRDSLEQKILTVRVGEELNFAGMEATLFDLGFRHVDYVYEPGEFAIRGSILDVYSFSCDLP